MTTTNDRTTDDIEETDDIEQWFLVRARWVVDLLRSGLNVAVIGVGGMGKSVTMQYAESMLAQYGLSGRVPFFSEWKGSHPLPRRSAGELFVVEGRWTQDVPRGFAVVPLLSLTAQTQERP